MRDCYIEIPGMGSESGEGAILKIDVEKNKEALHQFISN
jgi:hypothetical protein